MKNCGYITTASRQKSKAAKNSYVKRSNGACWPAVAVQL